MSFAAYVPTDRLHALAVGRDLPDRARGAALFADLAGFTRLTERLARALGSQRGAEELTRQLEGFYDALVGATGRFGGSVVSFSGDAVTCWFDEQGPPGASPHLAPAHQRAMACGLAMQTAVAALPPVTTPDDAIPFGVKVSVVAGAVRRFAVGDPAHGRMDVLAGATLDLLGAIEHLAAPGEVLVDSATAAAGDGLLEIAEWRAYSPTGTEFAVLSGLRAPVAPAPWPPLAGPVDDALTRPWLLPAVAERLVGGGGALLAELRRAVALFLSFSGIDYDDDEDAPVLLDAFVRRLQALAAAYGGSLLQLTTGDKGSYLYIAFGAPTAHHDAAANAVAAARAIIAMAPQLGFIGELRIGVAQGQMYCGAYGAATRRTYGVLGDATNLAARLMGICPPGQIRCDEGVYRAARRRWSFAELAPVALKGKGDPARIFRPVAPVERRAAPPAAPAGRAPELARLGRILDELAGGAGRVLALAGEAGVGKSLLADTFAARAAARGLRVLRGAAQSTEQQTPYRAWRDLAEALFELSPRDGPAARRERVARAVTAAAPRLAQRTPLLNDILHLGFADTPLTAALDARLRQESLLVLLIVLLREELRRRPLLLILEDVQWLDALSWQMTVGVARALLREGAPLLLAVVHRPLADREPATTHAAALMALPGATTLALGGLPPDAIVELAAWRLGLPARALPPTVVGLLQERATGNPFFAEELVDNLVDRALIAVAREQGGEPVCTVAPELLAGQAPLPETIEGLVLARIDRLTPEQQLLLKVAAVIGRSFGEAPLHATVRRYAAIERNALVLYLEGLERADLTLLETIEPELTYAFKHIITHDVAYETMLFGQRAEIHRAVAAWYEAAFAGRLEPYYPLLARHCRLAGDPEREAHYARLAGEQAAAMFANEDAVAYLARALELTPPAAAAARFDLLLRRERVYDTLGRRDEQAADLRALEALADRLDDDGRRMAAALQRARFSELVSDYDAGVIAAMRATLIAAVARDRAGEASGHRYWGSLLYRQAKYDEARGRLLRAIELLADAPPSQTGANALHLLAAISTSQGDEAGAERLFSRSLELYRQIGDRRGEATELLSLGMIASFSGDYRRARGLTEEALELYRQIGDRSGEAYAIGNMGDDCVALGDYGAALACQEQALALFQAVGSWEGEGWALHNLGEVRLALGDYEGARQLYEHALAIFRAIDAAEDECNALRLLGLAAHLQGDDGAALPLLEEALRIASALGYVRGRGYALTCLGHALLGLGRLDEAEAAYGEARALRERLAEPALVLEVAAGQARVALARGAAAAALALVEPILAHLAASDLGGADEPARIELTCYQALRAAGDPRAAAALAAVARRLDERAARIEDAELRRSFLTRVAAHRAILGSEGVRD
jgi:class 3 adenylate cyclase/tetratricopeptide (TPR) repeat protein